jgi:hydrophobe/amphiphile efflux-3 (HAE3) family protein
VRDNKSDERRAAPLRRLGSLVARRPVFFIAATLALTAALAPFIFRLRTEADVTKTLPEGDPGRRVMAVVDSEFGGSDEVAVVVESRDIFEPATLRALDSLAAALAALPGVTGVQGLTTLEDVRGEGDDIVISKVIDSVPTDPRHLAALRRQVLGDERYRGTLVSDDGTAALLLARLSPGSRREDVVAAIERAAGSSSLADGTTLSGSPALMKFVRDWMTDDLLLLLPLVVLVLALVLLVSFRSWYGVLLPLAGVLLALVWTLGLVGLLRQPITIVMVVLPPVLVSVGSAYGIHIIERWDHERRLGRDARSAVEVAVGNTGLPVFLAMATTVAGFGSNFVMNIVSIRAFAVFSALGIIFSFVLALTFVPAVLALVRPKRGSRPGVPEEKRRRDDRFAGWGRWVFRHRWAVIAAATALAVSAGAAALRVRPSTDFVRYFKPGSKPARAAEIVNQRFGGMMQFEFVVEGDIVDPGVLEKMARFSVALRDIPHITKVYSVVDVLEATNQAFNGGRPEFKRLPEARDAVAQYLLLLSFSGSEFLSRFITSDYRVTRITARFDRQESGVIAAAMTKIRDAMDAAFDTAGEDVRVSAGGMPLHQTIQSSQAVSVLVALFAVFLLVALVFRSLRLGLASLLPILFTLAVSFGVMGVAGLKVDVVTAMLGSIAIGIGIDYSCHLIARRREEQAAGFAGDELARRTIGAVGPAITANALAVGLGFSVLFFSSLSIIQKFGVQVAGTMLYSSIGALALLAAVLSRRPKNRR